MFNTSTTATPAVSPGAWLNTTTPELVDWSMENKMRNVTIGSVLLVVNGFTLVTVVKTRSLRPHTKVDR